jgi:hypothetical protein
LNKTGPVSEGVFAGLECKDFNNDGHPDIVASSMNYTLAKSIGIRAWTNNLDGTWTNKSTGLPTTGQYYRLIIVNFTGDNNLDIVACSINGVEIYKGDGTGKWARLLSTGLPYGDPASNTVYSASVGDINNDGIMDIAMGEISYDLSVWTGEGNGKWKPASKGLPDTEGRSYSSILLADINKDGNSDLFAGGLMPNPGIRMWFGDGAGNWTEPSSDLPTRGDYYDLKAVDINSDSNLDLIAARTGYLSGGLSPQIEIRYGNGTGAWSSNESLSMKNYSYAVAIDDVNGDGKLDMVASCEDGISFWLGETVVPDMQISIISICMMFSIVLIACVIECRNKSRLTRKK